MTSSGSMLVTESVRRFTFAAGECLYRDHLGRRVVADVEGKGFAVSDRQILGIADGVEITGTRWAFQEHLVAISPDGSSDLCVTLGREDVAPGDAQEFLGPGAGWVVGANSPFTVDDRHEIAPMPRDDFPVPFFFGVQSSEPVRAIVSPSRCQLIDTFQIDDLEALKSRQFVVQNLSKVTTLDSSFSDGTPLVAPIASHLNRASWSLEIPNGCDGLLLRKVYDRFHGRQRARVLVDGVYVGTWYEPTQDRQHRWGVATYGISKSHLQGKARITITIDPPPGTPLWSVSQMEVFAYSDRGDHHLV